MSFNFQPLRDRNLNSCMIVFRHVCARDVRVLRNGHNVESLFFHNVNHGPLTSLDLQKHLQELTERDNHVLRNIYVCIDSAHHSAPTQPIPPLPVNSIMGRAYNNDVKVGHVYLMLCDTIRADVCRFRAIFYVPQHFEEHGAVAVCKMYILGDDNLSQPVLMADRVKRPVALMVMLTKALISACEAEEELLSCTVSLPHFFGDAFCVDERCFDLSTNRCGTVMTCENTPIGALVDVAHLTLVKTYAGEPSHFVVNSTTKTELSSLVILSPAIIRFILTASRLFLRVKREMVTAAEITELPDDASFAHPDPYFADDSSPSRPHRSSEVAPSTPESHVEPNRVNTPPRLPLDVDLVIAAQADTKIFVHQVCLLKVPDDTTPHIFVVVHISDDGCAECEKYEFADPVTGTGITCVDHPFVYTVSQLFPLDVILHQHCVDERAECAFLDQQEDMNWWSPPKDSDEYYTDDSYIRSRWYDHSTKRRATMSSRRREGHTYLCNLVIEQVDLRHGTKVVHGQDLIQQQRLSRLDDCFIDRIVTAIAVCHEMLRFPGLPPKLRPTLQHVTSPTVQPHRPAAVFERRITTTGNKRKRDENDNDTGSASDNEDDTS